MRGWWQGDDGRLYHDTLTERVLDMLAKKEKDRLRQAEYRNRKRAVSKGVAPSSHVTNEGHTRDSDGVHWSHAGVTSPSTKHLNQAPESAYGTSTVLSAGEVVKAMRAEGIQKANPSNAKLIALLSAGVPLAVFVEAARIAAKSAEKNPFGCPSQRPSTYWPSRLCQAPEQRPECLPHCPYPQRLRQPVPEPDTSKRSKAPMASARRQGHRRPLPIQLRLKKSRTAQRESGYPMPKQLPGCPRRRATKLRNGFWPSSR